ncbi:hypothetical protein [Dyadobacter sp. NIV53]|uniref:hypothetical protein n=1 Tax=Dyadobacter sp. NIV53 TaxID=2861765 RepID=UPI001C86AB76|nr:hypothetical protein [Dyadobacter sp. NIV53]
MSRLYICILLLLISCSASKKPGAGFVKPGAEPVSLLVFLNFKISKISDSENSVIELISKKKVNGKINIINEIQPAQYTNYLTIDLLDDNDNLVSTTIIEHPLYRQVEFTADDNKKLLSKSISLKEESFFVRVQSKSSFSKIAISESLNKSITKKISLIDF